MSKVAPVLSPAALSTNTLRFRRKRHSDNAFSWSVLALPLTLWVIFGLIPIGAGVVLAFTNFDILKLKGSFVGLANFQQLMQDDVFWRALWQTLEYMVVANFGTIIIGLLLALLLNVRRPGVGIARTILYVPGVMSLVVNVQIFTGVFGPGPSSLLNWLLHFFGVPPQTWLTSPSEALPVLESMALYTGSGFTMVFYLAGLQGIPYELYEAAQIDGASRLQQFWYITVPQLRNVTVMLMILGYINNFSVMLPMLQMTSNGGPDNHTMTLGLYFFDTAFQNYQMGYGSAIAVVIFILIFIVSFVNFQLNQRNSQ